jgi:extracellular factor (EF) 3-hydroxypalmitic acid methyl ester biosynthesis protein
LCAPISRLGEALPAGEFDVVLSAGLFDYLPGSVARELLGHMHALTAPGGVTVIVHFHPDDSSRSFKDWFLDWPLIYRDAQAVASLFPDPQAVQSRQSDNGAVVYAALGRGRADCLPECRP